MSAKQNMFYEKVKQRALSNKWCLYPRNIQFLQIDIHCLFCVFCFIKLFYSFCCQIICAQKQNKETLKSRQDILMGTVIRCEKFWKSQNRLERLQSFFLNSIANVRHKNWNWFEIVSFEVILAVLCSPHNLTHTSSTHIHTPPTHTHEHTHICTQTYTHTQHKHTTHTNVRIRHCRWILFGFFSPADSLWCDCAKVLWFWSEGKRKRFWGFKCGLFQGLSNQNRCPFPDSKCIFARHVAQW